MNSTSEEADGLLAKLKSKCPMHRRPLVISGREFNIWTACDLDPLLDELSLKPDTDPDVVDERLPYWAELWPSAEVLAEAVLERESPLPAGSWLELGCGPGLPGIAAAARGCSGIATDYMQQAGWLTRLNAIENDVADPVRFERLDWREPDPRFRAGWILAADVVYEERNFQPLLDCFHALLAPEGEIWLAEPGRSVARPFFPELEEAGWRVDTLHRRKPVTIHRLRRASGR